MTIKEFVDIVWSSELAQATILLIVTTIVGRLLTSKGRLLWAISYQHHYSMKRFDDSGVFPVRTQQIWFQNWGREPLEDIEIILNFPPQHYEIWSPRAFDSSLLPDGRLVIRIPNIAGKEMFTLSMLDTFNELPVILNVRSKSGLGRRIDMAPQLVLPRWAIFLLWSLIVLGATTALFIFIEAVGILLN